MQKNTLIGISIVAVVLLVLGSLTNVVGYQSMKSFALSDSLLFEVRTKRATNQVNVDTLTFNYLGKGKENLLRFPNRDNKTQSVIKAIDFISKMDDKTFARFTELCIKRIRQDNTLRGTNTNEIVQTLNLLRTRSEAIINSFINRNNQNLTISEYDITICPWFPGCVLINILGFLLVSVIALVLFLILLPSSLQSCILTCGEPGDTFCQGNRCLNK
jgi:hypothetical protein